MASKQQFLDAHRANPSFTATQLAALLGCRTAYVRATARRNGITLPGAYGPRDPSRVRHVSTSRAEAKAQTRAALVEAARHCWAEPGSYEAQGIREIAAKAGYSTGAVFANFDSKADLWREAMGYEPPVDGPQVRALLQRMAQLVEAA